MNFMKIENYEVSQHTIESYLRACRYNQTVGSQASDQSQKDVYQDIIEEMGIHEDDPNFDKVVIQIEQLVDDLLKVGY